MSASLDVLASRLAWGAIAGAALFAIMPSSVPIALRDSVGAVFASRQDLPNEATRRAASSGLIASGTAGSTSLAPVRLVSLWRAGLRGGVTVLDGQGKPHSLQLNQEIGAYQLTAVEPHQARFSSPAGPFVLVLNAMPTAPDLARVYATQRVGGASATPNLGSTVFPATRGLAGRRPKLP